MSNTKDALIWDKIVSVLEDKLQYGIIEQIRSVVDVNFNGGELCLSVATDEAKEFFEAEVNQQRLIIVSRPIKSIEVISVTRVEAEPISD